jgi:Flp pilus assembly protein TadG
MSLIRTIRDEESGTSLLLVVLAMVVLLGFAGIAIDGAAAWSLRRQAQSAVDTGGVAGALFTAGKTQAAAVADATNEVVRITYNTLDPDMTPAQWAAEWATCTDPNKPAEFTVTGSSDCVSFTSNLDTLRVTTPTTPWITTFGQVIGFDQIDVRATAEVDTEQQDNGGVLPFALPGVAGSDGEICLKTGPNPTSLPPCDGPASGNFGFLDFSVFGDPGAGVPSICQGGNDRLENNIALGVDHPLGVASSFPAPLHSDRIACNDGNFNAQPYNVDTQTGNVAQALDDGLVDQTGTGVPGRLRNSTTVINVRGHLVDNKPLWEYFNGNGAAVCGTISDHDGLISCLTNPANFSAGQWSAGVIFQEGVIDSPRFGWVPLTYEPTLGPGGATVTFQEFRPVFIQTTFWGCNAGGCDIEWDPGEAAPGPGANNIRVEAASAVQIPLLALPESLRKVAPGTPGQVLYLISK